MVKKQKNPSRNFSQTFRLRRIWTSSAVYHLGIVFLYLFIPYPFTRMARDIVYDGPTKPAFIPDLVPSTVDSIFSLSASMISLFNFVLIDILFTLIFYIYSRGKHRDFNLWAIVLVSLITHAITSLVLGFLVLKFIF